MALRSKVPRREDRVGIKVKIIKVTD